MCGSRASSEIISKYFCSSVLKVCVCRHGLSAFSNPKLVFYKAKTHPSWWNGLINKDLYQLGNLNCPKRLTSPEFPTTSLLSFYLSLPLAICHFYLLQTGWGGMYAYGGGGEGGGGRRRQPLWITNACLALQQMCSKLLTLPSIPGKYHAFKCWGKVWVLRVTGKDHPLGSVYTFFLVWGLFCCFCFFFPLGGEYLVGEGFQSYKPCGFEYWHLEPVTFSQVN